MLLTSWIRALRQSFTRHRWSRARRKQADNRRQNLRQARLAEVLEERALLSIKPLVIDINSVTGTNVFNSTASSPGISVTNSLLDPNNDGISDYDDLVIGVSQSSTFESTVFMGTGVGIRINLSNLTGLNHISIDNVTITAGVSQPGIEVTLDNVALQSLVIDQTNVTTTGAHGADIRLRNMSSAAGVDVSIQNSTLRSGSNNFNGVNVSLESLSKLTHVGELTLTDSTVEGFSVSTPVNATLYTTIDQASARNNRIQNGDVAPIARGITYNLDRTTVGDLRIEENLRLRNVVAKMTNSPLHSVSISDNLNFDVSGFASTDTIRDAIRVEAISTNAAGLLHSDVTNMRIVGNTIVGNTIAGNPIVTPTVNGIVLILSDSNLGSFDADKTNAGATITNNTIRSLSGSAGSPATAISVAASASSAFLTYNGGQPLKLDFDGNDDGKVNDINDINGITNNTISNNNGHGIVVNTQKDTLFQADVTGNTIDGVTAPNRASAVIMAFADKPTLAGTDSFALNFSGNTIDRSQGTAVGLSLQNNAVGTFVVSDNQITNTAVAPAGAVTSVFTPANAFAVILEGITGNQEATNLLKAPIIQNNFIGITRPTTANPSQAGPNSANGIFINTQEQSVVQDLRIVGNSLRNNGQNNTHAGLLFQREDKSKLGSSDPETRAVTIANNTIGQNRNGILLDVRNGSVDLLDFAITDNFVGVDASGANIGNLEDGINLRSQADARLLADLTGNQIRFNTRNGVNLNDRFDNFSTDKRQIGGTWLNNTISDNGENGILITGRHGLPDEATGVITPLVIGQPNQGNLIENNTLVGIQIFGSVSIATPQGQLERSTAVGEASIFGNTIRSNGRTGVLVTSADEKIDIRGNQIEANRGKGIDLRVLHGLPTLPSNNGLPGLFSAMIRDNVITGQLSRIGPNAEHGDGIEMSGFELVRATNGPLTEANDLLNLFNAQILNNFIDSNQGRGIDVLNIGAGTMQIKIGDDTNTGRNTIVGNELDGIRVVNTGERGQNTQRDTVPTAANPLGVTHDIVGGADATFAPDMMLDVARNTIRDNGIALPDSIQNGGVSEINGSGLVILAAAVGQGADPITTAFDSFPNEVGANSGDPLAGNGRINLRVVENDFEGNFGSDFVIAPYIAVVPPTTGGVWDVNQGYNFSMVLDPLVRINAVVTGNTGNGMDVIRPAPDYTNDESVFKSRTTNRNPSGPFGSGTRRRNATRLAIDGAPNGLGRDFVFPGVDERAYGVQTGNGTLQTNSRAIGIGPQPPNVINTPITTLRVEAGFDKSGLTSGFAFHSSGATGPGSDDNFDDTANAITDGSLRIENNRIDVLWDTVSPSSFSFPNVDVPTNLTANVTNFPVLGNSSPGIVTVNFSDYVRFVDITDFRLLREGLPISNASNTPVLTITSVGHGLVDGEQVLITGVQGNLAANGRFTVANVTANTFQLRNPLGNFVAGTGNYTGGGSWDEVIPLESAPGNPLAVNPVQSPVTTEDPNNPGAFKSFTIDLTSVTSLAEDYHFQVLVSEAISGFTAIRDVIRQFNGQGNLLTRVIDGDGVLQNYSLNHSFRVDSVRPTGTISPITPDPRNSAAGIVTVNFDEAVTGVDIADFELYRNDGVTTQPVNLGSIGVTQISASQYTLNLNQLSGAPGTYELRFVSTDLNTPVRDLAGNLVAEPLAASTLQSAIGINDAQVTLSSVTGFPTTAPFTIQVDSEQMLVTTVAGATFDVTRGVNGTIAVAHLVNAPVALKVAASDTWLVDTTLPFVNSIADSPITTAITSPINAHPSSVIINFNESVSGVDNSDLTLLRTNIDGTVSKIDISSSLTFPLFQNTARQYELNLLALALTAGTYKLTINPLNSGIVDTAGNSFLTSFAASWVLDVAAPLADVVDVAPDPRQTPVDALNTIFSEKVNGVNTADASVQYVLSFDDGTPATAGSISDATNSGPIVVTSTGHGLANGDRITIYGVAGNTNTNGVFVVQGAMPDTFQLFYPDSSNILQPVPGSGIYSGGGRWVRSVPLGGAISGATNATPIAITSVGHGLQTGMTVTVSGVLGNIAGNGVFTVTRVNNDTFTLNGSMGNGAYTSGGRWVRNVDMTGGFTASMQTDTRYVLNLATVTLDQGTYILSLRANSGITDDAGNAVGSATDQFNVAAQDIWINGPDAAPTGTIDTITTPRGTNAGIVTVTFSEPLQKINGNSPVDFKDFKLTRGGAITGATNASPIVVTSVKHGLGTGSQVTINGVLGNTAANGVFTVTVIDQDRFSLNNSIGNGVYAAGTGNWTSTVSINNVPITQTGPTNYTLDLSGAGLTDVDGTYTLQLLNTDTVGVSATPLSDLTGNPLSDDSDPLTAAGIASQVVWVKDGTLSGPQVTTFLDVQRNNPLGSITKLREVQTLEINFTDNVQGIDLTDASKNFLLTRQATGGVAIPVSLDGITVQQVTAKQYRINLSTLTGTDGKYRFTVLANGLIKNNVTLVELKNPQTVSWTKDAIMRPSTVGDSAELVAVQGNEVVGSGSNYSLRQAVQEANALAGDDVIELGSGTYTLSLPGVQEDLAAVGDLDIRQNLVIRGKGVGVTIIDATALANQLTTTNRDRLFQILSGATVTIQGVTIQKGAVTGSEDGGAIRNAGTLTILDSLIQNSTSQDDGGAINNTGVLTIDRTTISGNTSVATGGAIRNAGTLLLNNSTLSNNLTTGTSGYGGALMNVAMFSATLEGVTISGNTAQNAAGGGIRNDGTLRLINDTIAFNRSLTTGAGISRNLGTVNIGNTIVSDNRLTTTVLNDVAGTYVSLGGNIVLTPGTAIGFSALIGDQLITNANLQPLANNGGPTQTHALPAFDSLGNNNPAIDRGRDANVTNQSVSTSLDQRGALRFLDGPNNNIGNLVDVGAFEFGTFFVNTTDDSIDVLPGDGLAEDGLRQTSLRAAIMESNALAGESAVMLDGQVYSLKRLAPDTTAPTIVSITGVPLAPITTGGVGVVTITFSERVAGFDLAHVNFTRTVAGVTTPIALPAATFQLTKVSDLVYKIENKADIAANVTNTGLTSVTQTNGLYNLTINQAANVLVNGVLTPVNIRDIENQTLAAAASVNWVRGIDTFAPTVLSMTTVIPPATLPLANVSSVTVIFSEKIVGVTAANFVLTRNGNENIPVTMTTITSAVVNDPNNPASFNSRTTVSVAPTNLTAAQRYGNFTLTFNPIANGNTTAKDASGNNLVGASTTNWTRAADVKFASMATTRVDEVTKVRLLFTEQIANVKREDFTLTFDDGSGIGPQPIDLSQATLATIGAFTAVPNFGNAAEQWELTLSNKQAARDGQYVLSFDGLTNGNQLVTAATTATVVVPFAPTATTLPFQIGEDQSSIGDLDIVVSSGRVQIFGKGKDDSTTVLGNPQSRTVIDGNLTDRLFDLSVGSNVAISGVEMISGKVVYERSGGAIRNFGTLTLNDDDLLSNFADGNGGAIFNAAPFGLQLATTGTQQGGPVLQVAVNNVVNTLTLNSVESFPSNLPFVLQMQSEQMLVTAVNSVTNQLTVTRGFNGTIAVGHAALTVVTQLATAGSLTAAVTTTDTTLTVSSVTALPANAPFTILVDSEQMQVTAVNSTTKQLTVVRGVNATIPAVHAINAVITPLSPTAALASAISNVATTLTLDSLTAYPSNAPFTILVGTEQMLVIAVNSSTNQFTVSRGINGTVATAQAQLTGVNLLISDAVSATSSTLTLTNVAGFPSNAPFIILVDSEQMRVTAVNAAINQFTVDRGYNGTAAVSHAANVMVTLLSSTTFNRSNFSTNIAGSATSGSQFGRGGAIFNENGAITINEGTYSANGAVTDGGAIYNGNQATASLLSTAFTGNLSGRDGGAIYNNATAVLTISSSILSSNRADATVSGIINDLNGDGGAIYNETSATLVLDDSLLQNNSARNGGALYNDDGTLVLNRDTFGVNSALENGGAVFNTSGGNLTLNQGLFTTNSASDNGGAIVNFGNLVVLDVAGTGTQFLSNEAGTDTRPGDSDNGKGAAIFNQDGVVNVSSATFTLNRSHGDAGVIFNGGNATLTIRRTKLDRNSADGNGGVLVNNDTSNLTIDEVSFSNNSAGGDGGAIYNNSEFTSGSTLSLTIDDTTLNSNKANRGGAIFNGPAGGLTMTNSTLSANIATTNGGGLANFGVASLLNDTLYLNDAPVGAGIANNIGGIPPFGPATLKNTLVAGASTGHADIDDGAIAFGGSSFVDGGHNLIGNIGTVTAFGVVAAPQNGNLVGNSLDGIINPQLDILRENGGPTLTHALLFGSPARDAGDNFAVTLNDQRGLNRVFDGDGNGVATVDIGAFESGFVINSFLDTVDENPGDGINADANGRSTLRAAIMEANARPGEDTIILGPGIFTLTLAGRAEDFRLNSAGNMASSSETGDLDILDDLNIIGAGTDLTFIDAAQIDRLFQVFPNVNLKLSNLTLQNGNATSTDFGGAIFNQGATTLDNVLVVNSSAGRGGGIYTDTTGTLTVEDSLFRGNQAVQQGGALYNDGTLTLIRSDIGAVSRLAAAITLVTNKLSSAIVSSATSLTLNAGNLPAVQSIIQIDSELMLVTNVVGNTVTVTRGVNGTTAADHASNATVILTTSLVVSDVSDFPTSVPFVIQVDAERMLVTSTLGNQFTVTRGYNGTVATKHSASAFATLGNVANVHGGGLFNLGVADITQSSFSGNLAGSRGGGLYNAALTGGLTAAINLAQNAFTLTNVVGFPTTKTFRIQVDSEQMDVTNVDPLTNIITVARGVGGTVAVAHLAGAFATSIGQNQAIISQSTFLDNFASSRGAAIYNEEVLTINNSTLSNNDSGTNAALGNTVSGQVKIENSTVVDNVAYRGGGLSNGLVGTVFVHNTIVANNASTSISGVKAPNVRGTFTTQGNNFVGNNADSNGFINGTNFDQVGSGASPFDPVLKSLANNGGSTQTHSARTGSPIIDAGNNTGGDPFDQRGAIRPTNGDSDIGSVEQQDVHVTINDVTLREGDMGSTIFTFTLSLTKPSIQEVRVHYTLQGDTAFAGEDFVDNFGDVIFAPNQLNQTLEVIVNGDKTIEPDEQFLVNLSVPADATFTPTLDRKQAVGTILSDDTGYRITDVNKVEGETGSQDYEFVVSVVGAKLSPFQVVTVDYTIGDGSARSTPNLADPTDPIDYSLIDPAMGTITFTADANGVVTATGKIKVQVNGDEKVEANENFFVNLTTGAGALPFEFDKSKGVGTIFNDDLSYSISNATANEGDPVSSVPMNFTVKLDRAVYVSGLNGVPTLATTTATVATASGTATAGQDFTPVNTTLTFSGTTTSQLVSVNVIGDLRYEVTPTGSLQSAALMGDTTLTLNSLASFPTNTPFVILVESEVMLVTAVNAGAKQFTVTRGFAGTAAAMHLANAIVSQFETIQLQVSSGTIFNPVTNVTTNDANVTSFSTSGTGTIVDNDPPPDQYHIYIDSGSGNIKVDLIQTAGMMVTTANLVNTSDHVTALLVSGNYLGAIKDDVFNVDFVNGNPIPTSGLSVDGLTQVGADSVQFNNGTFSTVTYNSINAGTGSVNFDGSVVSYTGLEPIFDNTNADNRVFNAPVGVSNDTISASASGGIISISGPTFESVTASAPVSSLTINSNGGNDTIQMNGGSDLTFTASLTINAGDGNDNVNLSGWASTSTINGGAGTDTITGGSNADSIDGGDGNDTITGGLGNDTLLGGLGADSIAAGSGDDFVDGGDGNDTIQGNDGIDTIGGGAGNDSIDGGAGSETVDGGAGDDTVNGGDDNDTVLGGDGNDLLSGSNGDDSLDGGFGDDTMSGDDGNDTINGQNGDDIFRYTDVKTSTLSANVTATATSITVADASQFPTSGQFAVKVDNEQMLVTSVVGNTLTVTRANGGTVAAAHALGVIVSYTGSAHTNFVLTSVLLTVGVESDILINTERANITAGNGNNKIDATTFGGSVTMNGAGGNDTLLGGIGNDSMIGGLGTDSASGGDGNDTINGGDGNDTINGDDGDDVITGDAGVDSISGGTGNDNASGGAGNDILTGGAGIDTLDGGADNDTISGGDDGDSILGGAGQDLMNGDNGDDTIDGGDGDDTAFGDNGNDYVGGGNGNDTLQGNLGDDSVNGNDGNDTLDGNTGRDTLFGGNGDDSLISDDGNDQLLGQGGSGDTFTFNGDMSLADVFTITAATNGNPLSTEVGIGLARLNPGLSFTTILLGVEIFTLNLNGGDDLVTIDNLTNVNTLSVLNINGGDGNDTIDGSLSIGSNVGIRAFMGLGNDSVQGTGAADVINGDAGNDTITGGAGADSIIGGDGNDSLNGNDGNDTINGGNGDDSMWGGAGTDSMLGLLGKDTIWGQGGNDTIDGGDNDDFLDGGYGNSVTAGSGNDSIIGGWGNDKIAGRDGNDTLFGDIPTDTVATGNDTIIGGAGNDKIDAGNGNDLVDGGDGNDTINGGAGNDVLLGGTGDDSILGGAGNDTLVGGVGKDTVDGQGGTDTVLGGNGLGTNTLAVGERRVGETINELFKITSIRATIFNELNF